MSQSNSLIVLPENLPVELRAKITAELEASAKEQLEKLPLVPQRIQMAPGGAGVWLFGDTKDARKPFKGIIIAYSPANAYWHNKDAVVNPILLDLPTDHNYDIPLCTSTDAKNGSRSMEPSSVNGKVEKCFGRCDECYLNRF